MRVRAGTRVPAKTGTPPRMSSDRRMISPPVIRRVASAAPGSRAEESPPGRSWLIGVEEQRAEPGLAEMPIRREGVDELLVAHHDEGDAVGQSPLLVRMALVQAQRPTEERRVDRDHGDIRCPV